MLKSLAAKIGALLVHYGPAGLFAMSFLDSSFIPFPGLNDLALILTASRRPALWLVFGMASTTGSVGGAYLLFLLARAGGKFFWRRPPTQGMANAQRWLERNEFAAILVVSLLPPPAPMKAFIFAAGLLQVNVVVFGLALLVGRGMRFLAEASLGARYGMQAQDYISHNLVRVSLALVAVVIGAAMARRWWIRRHEPES